MKSFIALRHDVRAVALGLLLPLMSWSAGHAQSLCSADAASIPATATSASMDEFALYLRFNRIIEESNIFLTAQDSFTASFTSFMEKYFSKIARTPEDALAVRGLGDGDGGVLEAPAEHHLGRRAPEALGDQADARVAL